MPSKLSLDDFVKRSMLVHQGSQHFEQMRYKSVTIEKFKRQLENDKQKIVECKENGVSLLFFSYELSKVPQNCWYDLILNEDKLKETLLKLIQWEK